MTVILKYNGIRIALTAVHLHMGYFGGSEPKHKILRTSKRMASDCIYKPGIWLQLSV